MEHECDRGPHCICGHNSWYHSDIEPHRCYMDDCTCQSLSRCNEMQDYILEAKQMLKSYLLEDGRQMMLCPKHAEQTGPVADMGKAQGGRWKCQICTTVRRLAGQPTDAMETIVQGTNRDYYVIEFPNGVIMCQCAYWKYQKCPVEDRTCKHVDYAIEHRSELQWYQSLPF